MNTADRILKFLVSLVVTVMVGGLIVLFWWAVVGERKYQKGDVFSLRYVMKAPADATVYCEAEGAPFAIAQITTQPEVAPTAFFSHSNDSPLSEKQVLTAVLSVGEYSISAGRSPSCKVLDGAVLVKSDVNDAFPWMLVLTVLFLLLWLFSIGWIYS